MPNFHNRPVDTVEALAAALVLYQENNCQVILDNNRAGHTSTRARLLDHFNGSNVITGIEQVAEEAAQIIKTIEHELVVSALSGRALPDFVVKVSELINRPTVPLRMIAYVGWAPHLTDSILRKNNQAETLNKFRFTSRHLGTRIHESVQLTITIVEQQYIKHYDSYRCKAYTDTDNIVLFYTKKKFSGTIGIRAKIKAHTEDNGFKITVLNFVKETK